MRSKKNFVLNHIITGIKEGKNPTKISKELGIKKQNLQYYIRQLKEKGIIEKEGYGVWKVLKEVSISSKVTQTKKQIRGHAFNWKVRFKYNYDWKRKLENNKIKYQTVGINNSTPRIIFNGKKIWFTKTGLVIYEPQSFFARSSNESKGKAVWELDKTIKMLGRYLKIDFGGYLFTTSREHYGMIKNDLARQYNDKGEKLYIVDNKGKWMWIDFSHGVHELETNDTKNSRGVQVWYNDMKKHNFEVTPTFILEGFNKLIKDREYYAENLKSHVEAIKTLSETVKQLKKEVIKLKSKN